MAEINRDETISEGITLEKNTKGYNWKIRLNSFNLKELKAINDDMIKEYGTKTNNSSDTAE